MIRNTPDGRNYRLRLLSTFPSSANSMLIKTYFGVNLLNTYGSAIDAQLIDITYAG